jgi:hypothetical protein
VVRALRAHLVLDQSTTGVLAVGPGRAYGGDETAGVDGVAAALHGSSFEVSTTGFSRSPNQVSFHLLYRQRTPILEYSVRERTFSPGSSGLSPLHPESVSQRTGPCAGTSPVDKFLVGGPVSLVESSRPTGASRQPVACDASQTLAVGRMPYVMSPRSTPPLGWGRSSPQVWSTG